MKVLGRLAMAAAMLVPIGVAVAAPAGAVNTNTAACTGTTGAINSVLTNNGVGDHGGLLLARKGSQQFKLSATTGTDCGTVVDAGTLSAVFTTATAVNCQTASSTTLGGHGTLKWTAPAGMGKSVANISWRWTSPTHLHYSGSVSATGSTTNVFNGQHVSGGVTTQQSLLAVANGGNCTSTIPLTHFTITGWTLSIHA